MKTKTQVSKVVNDLDYVLKRYDLRANRVNELKKARKIDYIVSEKVHSLLKESLFLI